MSERPMVFAEDIAKEPDMHKIRRFLEELTNLCDEHGVYVVASMGSLVMEGSGYLPYRRCEGRYQLAVDIWTNRSGA